MPEEKDTAQQEGTDQKPEVAQETPPVKAPGAPTLEKLRELESRYQAREAAANKRAAQAEAELNRLRQEMEALKAELEEARLYGDDEEAKQAAKALREQQRQFLEAKRQWEAARTQEEARILAAKKALAAVTLEATYGIPAEELMDCETTEQMEIKALRWEREHRRTQPEKPKPAPESGEQRIPRKDYDSMSTEEFLKEVERLKRQAVMRSRT